MDMWPSGFLAPSCVDCLMQPKDWKRGPQARKHYAYSTSNTWTLLGSGGSTFFPCSPNPASRLYSPKGGDDKAPSIALCQKPLDSTHSKDTRRLMSWKTPSVPASAPTPTPGVNAVPQKVGKRETSFLGGRGRKMIPSAPHKESFLGLLRVSSINAHFPVVLGDP